MIGPHVHMGPIKMKVLKIHGGKMAQAKSIRSRLRNTWTTKYYVVKYAINCDLKWLTNVKFKLMK